VRKAEKSDKKVEGVLKAKKIRGRPKGSPVKHGHSPVRTLLSPKRQKKKKSLVPQSLDWGE